MIADAIYERYGWTEDDLNATTARHLEDLMVVWEARGAVEAKRRRGQPSAAADTPSLIALAAREGFDVSPDWLNVDNHGE